MRPCAFIFFFCANLLLGRVVNFQGQKVRKDGGHQGKKNIQVVSLRPSYNSVVAI